MPLRVLFVDDEQRILDGLRRSLRKYRNEWTMRFVSSGAKALDELARESADVVVSDMRMPGMDGAELLARVRRNYPRTVRIILSGHSDLELVLRSVGPSHQYLTKPCDADHLYGIVTHACALQNLLRDERLESLAGGLSYVPSLPDLYQKLVDELHGEAPSANRVGDLIAQDPGMTAQLLRLLNSAYFGLRSNVSDPRRAVTLLGLSMISSLVLGAHIFRAPDPAVVQRFGLDAIWCHSLFVANCAREIARAESDNPVVVDESFTAGLLHDTGRVILAYNKPESYSRALNLADETSSSLADLERSEIGATHAEFGAYLMNLWGLPMSIVEAIAYHHIPSQCPVTGFRPLVAVHAANGICSILEPTRWGAEANRVDEDFIERAGFREHLGAWQEIGKRLSSTVEACP